MLFIKFIGYLNSLFRTKFLCLNRPASNFQSQIELDRQRACAMNTSIQAKKERIETSTGKTAKDLVSSILDNHNVKLRKELSSYE